jgi:hypothetical protein
MASSGKLVVLLVNFEKTLPDRWTLSYRSQKRGESKAASQLGDGISGCIALSIFFQLCCSFLAERAS